MGMSESMEENERTESRLVVHLLGEFRVSYGKRQISAQERLVSLPLRFLAYLIVFRRRELSQTELFELLWPEGNTQNPRYSLKALVYRVRILLKELDDEIGEQLVVSCGGSYAWNGDVRMTVDADDFERLLKTAEQTADAAIRLGYLQEAISLYRGDLLPMLEMEGWVVPIATYFHSLYLKAVHSAVMLLEEACDWAQVVAYCQSAAVLDPGEEWIHIRLVEALLHTNQHLLARKHYEKATQYFMETCGEAVSEEFRRLQHRLYARQSVKERQLEEICLEMGSYAETGGAVICDFEVFRELYWLLLQNKRIGLDYYVGLVHVGLRKNGNASHMQTAELLNRAVQRLLGMVKTLPELQREGHYITRYNGTQLLLLLHTGSGRVKAVQILKQLQNRFREQAISVAAALAISVFPDEK